MTTERVELGAPARRAAPDDEMLDQELRERRGDDVDVQRPRGIGMIGVVVALPYCPPVGVQWLGDSTFEEIAAKGTVGHCNHQRAHLSEHGAYGRRERTRRPEPEFLIGALAPGCNAA